MENRYQKMTCTGERPCRSLPRTRTVSLSKAFQAPQREVWQRLWFLFLRNEWKKKAHAPKIFNVSLIAERTRRIKEQASWGRESEPQLDSVSTLLKKSFLLAFLSFPPSFEAARKEGPQLLETDRKRKLQCLSTHFFPKVLCSALHPPLAPSTVAPVASQSKHSCCFRPYFSPRSSTPFLLSH